MTIYCRGSQNRAFDFIQPRGAVLEARGFPYQSQQQKSKLRAGQTPPPLPWRFLMKTKLLLLFALVPLLAAEPPKPDTAKDELKKFEGKWKLVSQNFDGKETDPEIVKTTNLVVAGSEFTLKTGTETNKGKITIDPGKKPKLIDVEFTEGDLKGSKVLGICEMDGDTRKSCFAAPDKDRPADFTSGNGKYIWTWKREKP